MDESVMGIRRELGDLLHLGWFNLYLDPFLRRLWIWTWNVDICSVSFVISKMIQGAKKKVRWPPSNGMIYISSEPAFGGDSEFEEGIFISGPWLLLWVFWFFNPKTGFDKTGLKQDILYIIWPQILKRFRIWSQNSKFVAVSITIATFVLN